MSINSFEVRIHLNYKLNLRLSNFIINSSILNTPGPGRDTDPDLYPDHHQNLIICSLAHRQCY